MVASAKSSQMAGVSPAGQREIELASNLRALRRRILKPTMSEADFSVRGFHKKTPAAREQLEASAKMFLTGYAYAAEAGTVAGAEARLEEVPTRFRGFAYEGAAMAYAVRDGLPLGHSHHTTDFLPGRGLAATYAGAADDSRRRS